MSRYGRERSAAIAVTFSRVGAAFRPAVVVDAGTRLVASHFDVPPGSPVPLSFYYELVAADGVTVLHRGAGFDPTGVTVEYPIPASATGEEAETLVRIPNPSLEARFTMIVPHIAGAKSIRLFSRSFREQFPGPDPYIVEAALE